MSSEIHSARISFVDGIITTITAQGTTNPGLRCSPDTADAKFHVTDALRNVGINASHTISVGSGDFEPTQDLAIAVAVLHACGEIPKNSTKGTIFFGRIANNCLVPTPGAVAAALAARAQGFHTVIMPVRNARAASRVPQINVIGARNLGEVIEHLRDHDVLPLSQPPPAPHRTQRSDMGEVTGIPAAREAIEVAIAGGHHLLLSSHEGGSVETAVRRAIHCFPEPDSTAALRILQVHDAIHDPLPHSDRPFRSLGSLSSAEELLGWRKGPWPGEITLAAHGILGLENAPQHSAESLSGLAKALGQGTLTLGRRQINLDPFLLIASMRRCPCGWLGSLQPCTCSAADRRRFVESLHPLLPFLDLRVDASAPSSRPRDTTTAMRDRIKIAWERQRERFSAHPKGPQTNAQTTSEQPDDLFFLTRNAQGLLDALDTRERAVVRRVARTVADIGDRQAVGLCHVQAASRMRIPM